MSRVGARGEEAVKVAVWVRITNQMEREWVEILRDCRRTFDRANERANDPRERERRDLERRIVLVGDQLLAESKRRVLPLYPQVRYTPPQTGSLIASEV